MVSSTLSALAAETPAARAVLPDERSLALDREHQALLPEQDSKRMNVIGIWYKENAPALRAAARRVVGDDADDVVQDVYMRLMGSNRDVDWIQSPRAYIMKMVSHAIADRFRGQPRMATPVDPASFNDIHVLDTAESQIVTDSLIRELTAGMSWPDWQIIEMWLDGYRPREISAVTGVSLAVVTPAVRQFRRRARSYLEQQYASLVPEQQTESAYASEAHQVDSPQPATEDGKDPNVAALRREIAQIRARARLTVREIASRTSPMISVATVHRALKCAPTVPKWQVLLTVARASQATDPEIAQLRTLHDACTPHQEHLAA
jgi:RNA polymerase sigma factor (sigma-70 family)